MESFQFSDLEVILNLFYEANINNMDPSKLKNVPITLYYSDETDILHGFSLDKN